MSQAHAPAGEKYYVPHSSKWPIIASASFFTLLLGERLLITETGDVAQDVVQRNERKAEREAAERESAELERELLVLVHYERATDMMMKAT